MNKEYFNIPNSLTILRVVIVPFFVYFLFQENIFFRIAALLIFILASITDLVDGYLARKWKQETEFGKFLDPLADKIIVVGCFVTFIFLHEQIEVWMVLLIICRDMMITSLRYIAIRQGNSIRTSYMGKIKTSFQMGAIIMILCFFVLLSTPNRIEINDEYALGRKNGLLGLEIAIQNTVNFVDVMIEHKVINMTFRESIFYLGSFVPYYGMLLTTIITVISGLRYLFVNKNIFNINNLKKLFK